MKLSIQVFGTNVESPEFQYTPTHFDNGVKYSVAYLRPHERRSKKWPLGINLGYVARIDEMPGAWYATYDEGTATELRWYGRFSSRGGASRFLLAAKNERDHPALFYGRHGTIAPLPEAYTGRL